MRTRLWMCALLALVPAAAFGAGAELNVVKSLEVKGDGNGAQVTIGGSRAPTFTVFRLADPARLVIDMPGADVSAVKGPRDGQGPIGGIAVSQFSDERAAIGRLIVNLAPDARYEVKAVGNDVLVQVSAGAEGQAAAPAAEPAKAEQAVVEAKSPETTVEVAPPAPAAQASATAPDARPEATEAGVVNRRLDEKQVKNPAHRLTAMQVSSKADSVSLKLTADGEVGTYEVVELENPPRLAVDLFGFEKGLKAKRLGSPMLREVRFGKHDDKVRMVLDASDAAALPEYKVERIAGGLRVTLRDAALAKAPASAPAAPVAPAPAAKLQAAPASKLAIVKDVAFRGDEGRGTIVVGVPRGVTHRVTRPDPRTAVLTLEGVNLPKRLERSLDTSAFGGPVKMVSSFTAPGQTDSVQIVATLEGEASDRIVTDRAGQLVWEFGGQPSKATASAEMVLDGKPIDLQQETATSAPRTGAFSTEAANYASAAAARRAKYTGRRVSFEFKDIDIHNLLRIIAEVSKRNVVVADNVSGKVTIRLRNVPWDQALELILRTKGLGKEEMGNILRIAPLKDLEEEARMAAERRNSATKAEALKVRLIPVNYAAASELAPKVKDVLTERGTMNVDQRTNVIIVKDVLDALARAEGLVRRLDTQTPQVLIEARIVEANSNFNREFGIQWGGNVSLSPSTGNPTGLIFPNVVRMAGASSSEGTMGTADVPNYAVNLPAAIGAGSGGGVGFVFGSAGGAVALNLRLTAMEANGIVKTVSAPKITTLDNKEATISQGLSIPFSQVSASGVNTMFIEAKLELRVTPHVTSDGSVLLKINASNNQADPSMTGANGQPAISKKEAQTEVLVKDGDTTVMGGIYTRQTGSNLRAVPVLSKIPVLGWLFKKHSELDNRTELLIFITPRIVNRSQIVGSTDSGNL